MRRRQFDRLRNIRGKNGECLEALLPKFAALSPIADGGHRDSQPLRETAFKNLDEGGR